jgi:hypothetical protein
VALLEPLDGSQCVKSKCGYPKLGVMNGNTARGCLGFAEHNPVPLATTSQPTFIPATVFKARHVYPSRSEGPVRSSRDRQVVERRQKPRRQSPDDRHMPDSVCSLRLRAILRRESLPAVTIKNSLPRFLKIVATSAAPITYIQSNCIICSYNILFFKIIVYNPPTAFARRRKLRGGKSLFDNSVEQLQAASSRSERGRFADFFTTLQSP